MILVAPSGMDRWLRHCGDRAVSRPQHHSRLGPIVAEQIDDREMRDERRIRLAIGGMLVALKHHAHARGLKAGHVDVRLARRALVELGGANTLTERYQAVVG